MNISIKYLSILFLTFLSTTLISCETMQGAGRDIESAGESVQDAAE